MATINKAATGTVLTTGSSWTGGVAPGSADIGQFTSAGNSSTTAAPFTIGAAWSIGQISVTNPTGDIYISGTLGSANRITLSSVGGTAIDMSTNTARRLSITSDVVFSGNTEIKAAASSSVIVFFGDGTGGGTGGRITATGTILKTQIGVVFFGLDSSSTWTSGTFVLNEGLLYVGAGNGSTTANGVLGSSGVTLQINSPGTATDARVSTSSSTVSRGINNPVSVFGDFGLGSTGFTSTTTLSGPVTLNVGATITTLSPATLSGVVSGANGFTKAGAGTLTLSNANTVYGTVTSTAGTLSLTNVNALQDATYQLGGGGSLSFVANSRIGGLSGTSGFNTGTSVILGGSNRTITATGTVNWGASAAGESLVMNSVTGLSVQTLNGTSATTRLAPTTTITKGAIQVASTNALYGSGGTVTGTTSVASGGGLWISHATGITPAFGPITINGTGAAGSLDGAIRNVSGNNTLPSVTLGSSSTIQSDAGVLTLSFLTLGSANTLTLKTTGSGGITLGAAATGTGTSALTIPVGTTVTAGTTSVLAATNNTVAGTFDTNTFAQTIASGKTLDVNGTWLGGSTLTTAAGTLDGTGSMTGAGGVSISSGGILRAGDGAASQTLSIAGGMTFASGTQNMTLPGGAGLTLSKVAVAGALTHTGTVTVNATGASWTSGSTHTFLTYGSRSGAGTFSAGSLVGGTGRQNIGNIVTGATAATFDIVAGNVAVTWAGGDGGNWYGGQTTGWTGAGVTDFINGDSVTFGSNTTTATITNSVTVASLTMNTASHVINGAANLTSTGPLSISGAFTQTLNVSGEYTTIGIGAGSTLELGNAGALGSNTNAITLTGATARLQFAAGANGLSTNRNIVLAPGGNISQWLTTTSAATSVTLGGIISGGLSSSAINKTGSGLVSLTGTNTYAAVTRVGASTTETVGENVLRVTPSALGSANLRLNAGSILEIDNGSTNYNFTRAYGTGSGQFYTENLVANAGGGFSSRGTGGVTVTQNIAIGTTPTTQWVGPMYFGTAFGTSQGVVTMSGTIDTSAASTASVPPVFYVFSGCSAVISNFVNNNLSGTGSLTLDGGGTLYIANSSGSVTLLSADVQSGTLEVGASTTNAIDIVILGAGTAVRKKASQGSTTAPNIAIVGNCSVQAEGSGIFTIPSGSSAISIYTVTLTGAGVGYWPATPGPATATGGFVKTGTGSWELAYAYPSLAAGFTGGVDVQQGRMKASKRFALGGGPITMTGGQLQFTDTTTSPSAIGTIKLLSTAGAITKPRIILGA